MYQRNIPVLYVVKFLSGLHFFGGVLIPFFTQWAKISNSEVFLIQAWFIFWAALLEVPTGAVADRFGRKISIISGLVVASIGFLIYPILPKLWIFLLAEFLIACGIALVSGADRSLTYATLKRLGRENEKTRLFGRIRSIQLIGILIAAPVGSLMATHIDMRIPTLATGLMFFVSSGVALLLKEPNSYVIKSYLEILKVGATLIWSEKRVRYITVDYVVVHAISFMMIWMSQLLYFSVGIPVVLFGILFSITILAETTVTLLIHRIEEVFGFFSTVRTSAYLTALGFGFAAYGLFTQNSILMFVGVIVVVAIGLGRQPLLTAELNAHFTEDESSTSNSTLELLRRGVEMFLYLFISYGVTHSMVNVLIVFGLAIILFSLWSPIQRKMY